MNCYDYERKSAAMEPISQGVLFSIGDASVLLQKLKAVSECSSCGQEFELQGMQASSAETAAAVPFTLTFR